MWFPTHPSVTKTEKYLHIYNTLNCDKNQDFLQNLLLFKHTLCRILNLYPAFTYYTSYSITVTFAVDEIFFTFVGT